MINPKIARRVRQYRHMDTLRALYSPYSRAERVMIVVLPLTTMIVPVNNQEPEMITLYDLTDDTMIAKNGDVYKITPVQNVSILDFVIIEGREVLVMIVDKSLVPYGVITVTYDHLDGSHKGLTLRTYPGDTLPVLV